MYPASLIAKYILTFSDPDNAGELVTNMKLQKLLYYAQGFSLAINERSIFNEPIEAWVHGPVVPKVYREYSHYGAAGIPVPEDYDSSQISPADRDLLDEVWSVYGQYSAWKLRNMTHEETPWKQGRTRSDRLITEDSLMDFFLTLVEK
ncbi:MAG: DUF4065 domain-containing protein [Candidatus Binatus sp.]|uniref:Panacea domain-containing protein n=1 Tax=Candidatus Binatus sp. TaxID=2811406 RepID=UPI0027266CD6|nr:type II toxin-antitoxin system antitoxin SocA domain-containing protein [Candidatus Binatus sp.]MDO8431954.1 DUF4065 domain-containing protein [Candidatus Binatus sp.]